MKKKPTHGGARKGAGRKAKEPTKVLRVPVSCVPYILKYIADQKTRKALEKRAEASKVHITKAGIDGPWTG